MMHDIFEIEHKFYNEQFIFLFIKNYFFYILVFFIMILNILFIFKIMN